MLRDAAGSIYSVGFGHDGSAVYFTIDKFNPNGDLLLHVPMNLGLTGSTVLETAGPLLAAGKVRLAATLSRPGGSFESYVFSYDTTSQAMDAVPIADGAAKLFLSGFAAGKTTYVVIGSRDTDGTVVIQKRRYSDDSIVYMVIAPAGATKGEAANVSADDFVANVSYSSSGQNYLKIYRLGSSVFSYSALTSLGRLANVRLCLSRDKTYAWTTGEVDVTEDQTDIYTRAFNLGTNAYAAAVTDADVGHNACLAFGPYATSGAIAIVENGTTLTSNAQAFLGAAVAFKRNFTFNADSAQITVDGDENPVLVTSNYYGTQLIRLKKVNGVILNSALQDFSPDEFTYIFGAVADAAGRVYEIQSDTDGIEHNFSLVGFAPASISVPGPYTVGGDSVIGTVSLDGVAPVGGATFTLTSGNPAAIVPASVTIPAGESSQTFTINTTPVAANAKPAINANYQGLIVQTTFDLAAPLIQSITATPQSQYGGVNITATLKLTGKAPAGGLAVSLSSSNPGKVAVQSSATVVAGAMTKNILLTTTPTLVNASAVISAKTGAVTKTVFVAVLAPVLQSAVLTTNTIKGGQTTTMTVTLGSKAPSGYTVTLLSGAQSIVPLPNSYAVPANTTSVGIPVHTNVVTSSIDVTLVAYRGPYVKVMTLTVHP